jgi:hypothetical protein
MYLEQPRAWGTAKQQAQRSAMRSHHHISLREESALSPKIQIGRVRHAGKSKRLKRSHQGTLIQQTSSSGLSTAEV